MSHKRRSSVRKRSSMVLMDIPESRPVDDEQFSQDIDGLGILASDQSDSDTGSVSSHLSFLSAFSEAAVKNMDPFVFDGLSTDGRAGYRYLGQTLSSICGTSLPSLLNPDELPQMSTHRFKQLLRLPRTSRTPDSINEIRRYIEGAFHDLDVSEAFIITLCLHLNLTCEPAHRDIVCAGSKVSKPMIFIDGSVWEDEDTKVPSFTFIGVKELLQGSHSQVHFSTGHCPRNFFATCSRRDFFTALAAEDDPSLGEIFSLLLTVSILKDWPPPLLRQLALTADMLDFPRHTVIFREGDPSSSFFIVVSGTLSAVRLLPFGGVRRPIQVAHLHPGDYFGEGALLTDSIRKCAIVTESPCTLLSLPKAQFDKIVVGRARAELLEAMEQYPDAAHLIHLLGEKKRFDRQLAVTVDAALAENKREMIQQSVLQGSFFKR